MPKLKPAHQRVLDALRAGHAVIPRPRDRHYTQVRHGKFCRVWASVVREMQEANLLDEQLRPTSEGQ